jgi:hypothetical protein
MLPQVSQKAASCVKASHREEDGYSLSSACSNHAQEFAHVLHDRITLSISVLSVYWGGMQAHEQIKVVAEEVAQPASLSAQPRHLRGTQRTRRQLRLWEKLVLKGRLSITIGATSCPLWQENPGPLFFSHGSVAYSQRLYCCVLPLMLFTQHLSPVTFGTAPWGANRIQALRLCQSSNLKLLHILMSQHVRHQDILQIHVLKYMHIMCQEYPCSRTSRSYTGHAPCSAFPSFTFHDMKHVLGVGRQDSHCCGHGVIRRYL